MKLLLIYINHPGGGNIYFDNLFNTLKGKMDIDRIILPSKLNYLFFLTPIYLKSKGIRLDHYSVIHSDGHFSGYFKVKDKLLITTEYHNIFDKDYFKSTNIIKKIYYNLFLKNRILKSLRASNKIIAISKYTKDSFNKFYPNNKTKVIYPIIDTNKFKPMKVKVDDKRFKLLFTGNLIKRKGVDLLPKIMEKLGPEYVLYYTSGLRSNVPKNFNLPNMVSLGKLSQEDLIKEYNKCDALLFPTRLEGFGYAVAEAMACGKPVIATNCSSIPELVDDGVNGFLCKIDDVDDFVEKIKLLANDINLIKIISERNRRKIVEKFNISKMGNSYKKLLGIKK